MGVIIKGTDDTVKAADGSLSIEGFSIKTTGIGTFDGGIQVGSAATIHSNGNLGLTGIITATNFKTGDSNVHNTGYNVGSAITMQGNGNIAVTGIITASSYIGDGSALTGIAGTEITDSDFQVGVSTFMVDYTAGRVGVGTDVPARQFDVYSPTSGVNLITLRTGAGAYGQAGIAFASNPTASREKATIFFQERTGGAHHAGDLVISIDGASGDAGTAGLAEERVRFQASGHVGIGTSMPSDRVASSNTRILNVGIVTTNTVYASTFVPSEGQLSNRNIIINGAMQVAQRGTTSGSSGYKTVDRWQMSAGGANAALTQTPHALTSSDTGPWEKGFKKSFHILNAGQSGPDGDDYVNAQYRVEAQDIAQSGWDYTSASSNITLSFWIKSSVAQNFYGYLRSRDGTEQRYGFETGSLTADTWTKITKTIPGNSNIQFDNDNGEGLRIVFTAFLGTNYTASGTNLSTWEAYSSSTITPDQTSTWWTTSSATFEITGVQLEVGSKDTPFEHRSFAEELYRCQRYYQRLGSPLTSIGDGGSFFTAYTQGSSNKFIGTYFFPVEMRDTPSAVEWSGTVGNYGGTCDNDGEMVATAIGNSDTRKTSGRIHLTVSSVSGGKGGLIMSKSTDAYFAWSAEL